MYHCDTMAKPHLTVVIPAFNEADRLPDRLDEVLEVVGGRSLWRPLEVVVVDDGSGDETAAEVRGVQPPLNVVLRLLTHAVNQGKGAAVRTGLAASRGDLVLVTDADRSTPMNELDRLGGSLARGSVVIGSRAVDRSRITRRQPLYRDFMGRVFNLLVRGLLLPGIHDTQCGFKLYPGGLARVFARVQRIEGFAFDVEHLWLARRWGWRIIEQPVAWAHADASRVAPIRHSWQMARDVLGLRLFGNRRASTSGGISPDSGHPAWLAGLGRVEGESGRR